ncbi:MAG: hypothetical protein HeimC3_08800 [Candidatus Heimdallarchaeota archaeon LC_3]|nr:MAG: hypothetical protein HeimC3_08800 [Candidatus Heimdallarchaeota archaeon LC_3]
MVKPTSIIFGLKTVWRRKQKNLFAIFAIALGVSLIAGISITRNSLGEGFGVFFTYSLGERDGSVSSVNGFIDEPWADAIGNRLVTDVDDVVAFTTSFSLPISTSTDEGQINVVTWLIGINQTEDSAVFGRLITTNGDTVSVAGVAAGEAYVGKTLADDLLLTTDVSDEERSNQFDYSLSIGPITIEKTLTVKGIIKNEERGATGGNLAVYTNLNNIQEEIGNVLVMGGYPVPHPITLISLKFSDNIKTVDDGDELVEAMKDSLNDLPVVLGIGGVETLIISAERVTIKNFGKVLSAQLSDMLMIFGFIIIFAGLLLIVNIQFMTVEDRQQQTGIQRAIGTQRRQIVIANLTEFLVTGIIGGLVGIIGGMIYSQLLILAFGNAFEFDGSLIPVIIDTDVMIMAFFTGFFLALLTGLLPSIRASRIHIVETLRGVENKAESIERGTGMMGLYVGTILTLLGIVSLAGLNGQPWDFPNAYKNIDNAEAIFFAVTFLLVGLSVLLSYFVSKDLALNIAALLLVLLPVVNALFIFGIIEEGVGSGGMNLFLGMILSMIAGSILLIGINLHRVADFAEKLFSRTYSAVAMLSFRQMASQRTRSTLTFSIFAVILTLNIFLASFAYSMRYGSVNQVEAQAGGSDILIFSGQAFNSTTTTIFLNGLKDTSKFPGITWAQAFPNAIDYNVSLTTNGEETDDLDDTETWRLNFFAINNQSLWESEQDFLDNKPKLNLLIETEKIDTTKFTFSADYSEGFEIDGRVGFGDRHKDSNLDENKRFWSALAKNEYVTDKSDQKSKPFIVVSPIIDPEASGLITYLKKVGDSVWLSLKDGTYKEFVIAAHSEGNPLFDARYLQGIEPGPSGSQGFGAFISETEARDLKVFNPTENISLLDQNSHFLVSGKDNVEITSKENVKLAQDIEAWSNGVDTVTKDGSTFDTFRKVFGFYGIVTISIYELYEILFDGMFRMFGFLQIFTSFGFIVGVLGLLVVSVRSVQERKREIGMMRSIGLKSNDVLISIMLELSVMGVIGLAIGIFNGNVLGLGIVRLMLGVDAPFLIPWFDPGMVIFGISLPGGPGSILFYTVLTLGAAFVAAIIPGRSASKIPPSEALRYTG